DAGACLGRVAAAGGGAADGAGGDEVVGGAIVPLPIAALGDVARARRRAADRRALGVGRTRRARSGAILGQVADARRRPAQRGRRREVVGRAVVADAVAALGDVARARGRAADPPALHVGRAEGIRAGARLGRVAAADRGPADGAGRDEVVGRAVVPLPVAALGDVARA